MNNHCTLTHYSTKSIIIQKWQYCFWFSSLTGESHFPPWDSQSNCKTSSVFIGEENIMICVCCIPTVSRLLLSLSYSSPRKVFAPHKSKGPSATRVLFLPSNIRGSHAKHLGAQCKCFSCFSILIANSRRSGKEYLNILVNLWKLSKTDQHCMIF